MATYRSMLDAVPEFSYGLATSSWTLRHTGDVEGAVRAAEKALELSSGGQLYVAALGSAYAVAGRTSDARMVLERGRRLCKARFVLSVALIHFHLGERDEVLRGWKKRTRPGVWAVWLGVEPQLDPLRGEPIFEAILHDEASGDSPKAARWNGKRSPASGPVTAPIAMPTADTQTGENEEAHSIRPDATTRRGELLKDSDRQLKGWNAR